MDRVKYREEIRGLGRDDLNQLVEGGRQRYVDVVSQKGGHFGASLGVAELTVAFHYVYDTPRDQIVWDTGHQAYIHKMLTGRNEELPTIRTQGGLAIASPPTNDRRGFRARRGPRWDRRARPAAGRRSGARRSR